ncbi:hypothetical protein Gogos_000120 [Gossypium gossypioides]|uniref:Uncharacterized protein n=1 Tax=Gossypium gossypioides TaxID=34282 RepID=A0A7J9CXS1_GOSGO|nr:hypothetical protein [Gossypium gossypioides]
MLNYDTIDSSSSSNSDNYINLEDFKVTSYKSDKENTSTDEDENIEIQNLWILIKQILMEKEKYSQIFKMMII